MKSPRCIPCRIASAFGFLLLSLAVSIVVAWLCAVWPGTVISSETDFAEGGPLGSDLAVIRYNSPRALLFTSVAGDLNEPFTSMSSPGIDSPDALVPGWASNEVIPWGSANTPWPGPQGYDSRSLVVTGWPLPSMWASFDPVPNPIGYWSWNPRTGWRLPDAWQPPDVLGRGAVPRTLAARFVWQNTVINTIFYAIVLWLIWTIPVAIRRRRRIKHGLCPACTYPVGVSKICTECGAAVSPRQSNAGGGPAILTNGSGESP